MNASVSASPLLARRKVLGPAYRLFYEEPLAPVRGEDVWLYDADNRAHLDAYNNVPVVGHCHPHVVEAMARQASTLNTHTRYLHEGVLDYADRLVATFPEALDTAMFTCTGSEANDLALRIARAATGGTGFIVTDNAYHGVTAALADMSPSLQPVVGPHVRTVPSPAALQGLPAGQACIAFAASIDAAAEQLRQAGFPPAALLLDTVFASDGIHTEPPGLLDAAAQAIRRQGGLFIADEVQGGFGRSGGRWWAFQRDDVVPDIVTLGKPMGNGHPMAGVVMRAELAAAFAQRGRYFNTFGGNPVSAAVGMAVLDVIERQALLAQVSVVGDRMHAALEGVARRHCAVTALRGSGLYRAVELTDDRRAGAVMNALRSDAILVSVCGPRANVLKIRPPLTFSAEHVDFLAAGLDRALSQTGP